ncbi:MAG: deoxyribonuclease IV [Bacteroidales bacterium]|nr:deoxyribonuclease IV [Bacteroidales bacterium]
MPLIGAHLSIAGGFDKAVTAAMALGMDTVQIFTHAPSRWEVKPRATKSGSSSGWSGNPIPPEQATTFRQAVQASPLQMPTAHDSYLINLAAPNAELRQKSIAGFANEIARAEALGLTYLVTHPGAHVGSGEETGLAQVAEGLNAALQQNPNTSVTVLLETTAGQGTCLGHRFEQIAQLLNSVSEPRRFGVCLDTCHIFAAGYDLRTDAAYEATFAEFDRVVGLSHIKLFHVNDSAKPLGSRVDRHAGIGLGHIGDTAFRRLLTDPRFQHLPMILETPKEDDDGQPMDPINLDKLRGFLADIR